MTNVTAGAYADIPLFLFHLLEYLDVEYEVDVDEINARWAKASSVDVWSQLVLKETRDRTEQLTQAPKTDDAATARVLMRLSPPLPRQKFSLRQIPAVLLDWQFAPAWPRVAALACCAAVGFYVGIAGLDRPFDSLGTSAVASSADLGVFVFEPEPLIGARP
jgi:hypothetical protein